MRIFLVPVFMIFILINFFGTNDAGIAIASRCIAALSFSLAAITDFFDGKIARKKNLITNFGKFLDPLADKFMVFGAVLSFCSTGLDKYFDDLRIGFIISGTIVIFRELAVTSIRLVASGSSNHLVIAASWLGKVKTFSQCIYILIVILEPVVFRSGALLETHTLTWVAMSVMTIMTIWSGVDYIKTYWSCLNPNE